MFACSEPRSSIPARSEKFQPLPARISPAHYPCSSLSSLQVDPFIQLLYSQWLPHSLRDGAQATLFFSIASALFLSPRGVYPLSSFSGRSLRTSARIAQFCAQIAHQPLCLPHMRKNRGEGGSNLSLFPFCNSTPNLESLSARGYALLVRPFHSFTKECFRTLLQPITSALFLKTAGRVGSERSIRPSLFVRLVLFCLPTAARAQITTKPIRFCNIQWRTDQG